MKRLITVLLLAVLFLNTAIVLKAGTLYVFAKEAEATKTDTKKTGDSTAIKKDNQLSELGELSKELTMNMSKGNFKETYNTLSPLVKLQLTEMALKESWDMVVTDLGSFKDIRSITEETADKITTVTVILNYEHTGVKIVFYYNADKKLDGLWLNYAPYEPEITSNKYFKESAITFGSKKNPINGIFTLPKNVKKPPVVILVQGSGDHDADESIGSNKPFRDLAHGLAKKGIAVIRYNESSSITSKADFTIQDDCLNDAAAAIKYAKSLKTVDTKRIYIIGHSLGGMMAPKIAADNKDVAGIVSLAGSPRKLEDIILDQTKVLLEADKSVTPLVLNYYMSQIQTAVNKVKNLKKSSEEIILNYPASYWYSLNQIDIPAIVKQLDIPIFIAQGSADFQVYADIDYVAWQDLLKDKKNVTFKLYDNLNHLFMKSNGRISTTEYNIKGTVDSRVIDDIAKWILNN